MIPVLFKEDEQVFSHNGIGALYESLSCDVIEEENGAFTMELEYPVDGELFSEIKDFRIIQAKPNDIDEPHNFRIYEIVKSIDELTVYIRANTRTNDLGNNLITSYVGKGVTSQQAMNGIKNKLIEPTNFDLISDIQTKSNVEWTRINPLNAIVGIDGSMVDVWGGEIKRTNTAIHLYSRRGRDNVVTIRPGKNIEGLNMTVSTAGLVTKVLPTFSYRPVDVPEYQMVTMSDGSKEKRRVPTSGSTTLRDDITVLGDVVSSQYVDNYPTNYWSSVDYGDDSELRETIDDYIDNRLTAAEDSPTILDMSGFENELKNFVKTELDKKAKQYFTHRSPGVDKPTVRIQVDMLQLSDSPDWEEFKDLERIGLTDTLDVWVEEYDIDVEVRVTTLTYDSIGEQVISFNAGSDRAPRQSAIEKKYDDLTQATNNYITSFKNGVQNIMRNTADGLNRKFEGYTEPPAELSSEGDIWFKQIGEGKVEIWIHDGVYWQPLMTEDFGKKIEADIEAVQSELEEAKQQAVADSEQALADAKAHAEAEDSRIRGELELEVGGAIEIAEQAKQDAIDRANQALIDAKAHADAEIVLIGDHFDGIIEGVESDVANAQVTADSAVAQIDTAVTNAGFTSLDETISSVQSISNQAQIKSGTAIDNALEAMQQASLAVENTGSLNVRVDEVEDTLSVKADKQTVDDLTGIVDLQALDIKANAQGLALKANQDTVDLIDGRVSSLGTEVNAVAGQVNSRVWNTDIETAIDGIEVGGRNYFIGNEFATRHPAMYTFDEGKIIIKGVDSTSGAMLKVADLEPNTSYILHFSEPMNDRFILPSNATNLKWSDTNKEFYFETGIGESQELRGKFYPIEQTYPLKVYIKLEKGTKATDWTPAPEDTDAKITHIETEFTQTFDSFSQTVAGIDGRVTSQKQTIDIITQTVTDHTGKIATVEQNVHGIQQTVSDPVNGLVTQVSTLANGFNVLAKDFEDMEIGGRNLIIRNTETPDKWIALSGELDTAPNHDTSDYIKVDPNTDYMLTKNKSELARDAGFFRWAWYDSDMTYISRRANSNNEILWKTPNDVHYVRVSYPTDSSPKLEKGNKATDWTPAPEDMATQAQFSVLSDNINMRVSKGELMSQINIEAGRTLIQSNKLVLDASSVIFTGSAFIPSAQIQSIHADKITAGTISTARLDATAIVTAGLTANVIKSTHIETSTATVDKIFATDVMVNRLTAKTAFITSVKAVDIDAARITTGTINAARLNASDIVTAGLSANVVKASHISGDTALFDKLFSTSSATDRLSAQTAWIKDGMFTNASISGARIQDATIGSAKISTLDASKISTGRLEGIEIIADHGYIANFEIVGNSLSSLTPYGYTSVKGGGDVAFATASPEANSTTGAALQIWHDGTLRFGGLGTRIYSTIQDNLRIMSHNRIVLMANATVESNSRIIPQTNGDLNLGESTKRWSSVYSNVFRTANGVFQPTTQIGSNPNSSEIYTKVNLELVPEGAVYSRANIIPWSSNYHYLGLAATRWKAVYTVDGVNESSDERLKKNIQKIDSTLLEKAEDIKPIMYEDQKGKISFGYSAQDVQRTLTKYAYQELGMRESEVLEKFSVLEKGESYLSLRYRDVEVMKGALRDKKIEELENRIKELENAS